MTDEHEEISPVNWRERLLCLVLGLFVGTLLTVLILTANKRTQPAPIIIEPAPPLPTNTPLPAPTVTTTPAPYAIYVSGAVVSPGVYEVPVGARIGAVIELAGGFTEDAAAISVNLAQPLRDGDQVHVPSQVEFVATVPLVQTAVPATELAEPGAGGSVGRININEASATELETLPGIGPSTAAQIIAYRDANGPFPTIAAIMEVPGIGPAKFAGIEELIGVD